MKATTLLLLLLSCVGWGADPQLGLGPPPASASVFPGGVPASGQVAVSNGSGLIGSSGFTSDTSGDVTIAGANGSSALLINTATQTGTSFPAINATQTWNNGSNQFYGYIFNVVNTASAGSSQLFTIRLGGVNKCSADLFGDWNVAGQVTASSTADATSITTGGFNTAGGVSGYKNMVCGEGFHGGVTITATAATTTTITSASTGVQIFTGTTTQTIQLPAASLFSAGVSAHYTCINRSTGLVSFQRAGSDQINGNTINVSIPTQTTSDIYSDGVSNWYTR